MARTLRGPSVIVVGACRTSLAASRLGPHETFLVGGSAGPRSVRGATRLAVQPDRLHGKTWFGY
ncbi:hypothetical protein I545_0265 [Mycobacterium kansasii 662]|uniref:Uncharacterized protein n=2 Tax=Mycobacterium kansasii TaxID=1768 RepID=A0A1V3WM11_MYCKA|nr:hypothetical protein I545_0265 [Mycobacterium kansasii 662]OOK67456.1 hypothetical protein BZL30_7602 [Mycobacterium kansasii]OOK77363.1 hypothetical protein BZL29_3006 [Mycobacterium kansasii]